MFKHHTCKGYKAWRVDAETIAPGSADQAFEGLHYYRSMRLHKECFDAMVQFRIDKITGKVFFYHVPCIASVNSFISFVVGCLKGPKCKTTVIELFFEKWNYYHEKKDIDVTLHHPLETGH